MVDAPSAMPLLQRLNCLALEVSLHTLHGKHDRRVRGLAVVHETEIRPRVLRRHRLEAESVTVVVEAPPTQRVAVPSSQPVLIGPSAIQ